MNKIKQRILIPVSINFAVRYLFRTGLAEQIQKFAQPVFVFTWDEPTLLNELKERGFECHVMPECSYDSEYLNVRKLIDLWFDRRRLKSPGKGIQRRYLDHRLSKIKVAKRKIKELLNLRHILLKRQVNNLFDSEKRMLEQHSNIAELRALYTSWKPDAFFTLTPFHKQEELLSRIAKENKIPCSTAILSFDNLTKRGWIPVIYDQYLVWNKYNASQVSRIYPETKEQSEVIVTGAPQFDFYFSDKNIMPLEKWCSLFGLDPQKPVLLYAGGPVALFPNEPSFLKDIVEAKLRGDLPSNLQILFRCHPIDKIERWKNAIGEYDFLFYDESWSGKEQLKYANITEKDIDKLVSTLKHSAVHVNVCSTMTVDGCAFDRPQIGPAYDPDKLLARKLKRMYWQEHFLPIVKTGGLSLADSKEELIQMVAESLDKPNDKRNARKEILENIITYTDGKSADRVAMQLREFLEKS
ncbi:MAG TPA: CDP-glycerol glycerophosphotransferase family protein [Chryseolinea sp.]|nr:CDP-glycerol glycerophosphotransferase family protein [Chryseolinea sp.]